MITNYSRSIICIINNCFSPVKCVKLLGSDQIGFQGISIPTKHLYNWAAWKYSFINYFIDRVFVAKMAWNTLIVQRLIQEGLT